MLSDLIRCSQAMPQQHYVTLDESLESLTSQLNVPVTDPAFVGVLSARLVLMSSRNEDMPGEIDAALEMLASVPPGNWQVLRGSLLDMREAFRDLSAGVPITAWIGELVTEVDGRRLDYEAELSRMADGGTR